MFIMGAQAGQKVLLQSGVFASLVPDRRGGASGSPLVPSLRPSQLAFCTGVHHAMPPRLSSHQRPVNKQKGARTIVPEAGTMANLSQHGCTGSTTVETLLTNAGRGIPLPAANHTHCLLLSPFLLSGSPRLAQQSPDKATHPHDQAAGPSFSTWPSCIPPHIWDLYSSDAQLAYVVAYFFSHVFITYLIISH